MPPSSEQTKWFAEQIKDNDLVLRGYLQKRFPSLADHDDILQEAYRRLLRVDTGTPRRSVTSFLFKVARNLAIDMLRRRRVVACEPIGDAGELSALQETPSVADSLDHQQRRAVLVDAIAALPQRCREVIMLRHIEGLSYHEIAERLGISPHTVKVHIVKGMKDCTAYFRRHGLLDEVRDGSEASPPVQLH